MTTTNQDYCINCKTTAKPDCELHGHIIGTLGHEQPASAAGSAPCFDYHEQPEAGKGMCRCGFPIVEHQPQPAPPAPETGEGGKRYLLSEVEHLLKENQSLVAERERLVEALRDLVRQLPTDERLADYNLDLAESALATIDQKGSGSERARGVLTRPCNNYRSASTPSMRRWRE